MHSSSMFTLPFISLLLAVSHSSTLSMLFQRNLFFILQGAAGIPGLPGSTGDRVSGLHVI